MVCSLAARLMQHPAAPYHEHAARGEVERICAENGLDCERDRFGNLLVRLLKAGRQRVFVLAAHLDHPGFGIVRSLTVSRWLARFQGGVPDEYFQSGIPVRLMPGGARARLGRRKGKELLFELFVSASVGARPRFAVWELEDFAVRNGRIYGRACDDLIGVAAALATMIELKRLRVRTNVLAVISRAEEIGFQGALAVAAGQSLPPDGLIVSMETSRELPGVKMGQGVILRVGDRTSIFDAEATRFLGEIASGLKRKHRRYNFQRGLMSGGTCEATAYQEFGFQTAAVCVPLGNYHNCAKGRRIKEEYVSLADVCSMIELLVVAGRQMRDYPRLTSKLPRRLKQMLRTARGKLPGTAHELPAI